MDAITAKVFRAGNSKAIRLPGSFKIKAKSLVIEQTNGGLFLYDPKEREKEMKRRRKVIDRLWALGPLPEGVEFERP